MPSSYTPSLKLILQATGENSGNWGNLTNTDFTSLIELAVAGYESISMVDADRTLTNGDGSTANEARYAFVNMVSSVALTVARNVIVPTASKLYFFENATTGGFALTVKTSAGTGISVPNGKVMVLMCDGTNVIDAVTSFSSLTLATALPVTSGGTGVTTSTGSGSNVLSTSPTLVTPALGTPSALVGTNITGTATSFTASNVTTNANLTGAVTSVGNAASLGSFTSAQLATALTDETGSGANVFATSPTLVTPALGTPSALVGTNITGTATAFTASNVTTNANLTGMVTSVGNAASLGSFTSAQLATALTDETGTGANVFAVSPTFTGTVGVAALNTTGKLGVGTATPAGIFSVVSTTSTGTSTSAWSDAYSVFGPNSGSTNGAALGIGYNTTADRSEILSLEAGVAWKTMNFYTAGVQFNPQTGSESVRITTNNAAAGVVSMALRVASNNTSADGSIVAIGLGVQNDGFSKGGIGWVRGTVGSDTGSLAFYNNGTNDSSNISTADEAMQIDINKILLVGTTSATGTTSKLQVNSDAIIHGLTIGQGNSSVASNTAIGASSLSANTTGGGNVAVGSGALQTNLVGANSTAVGYNALYTNKSPNNTAIGSSALYANDTGANCVAIGSGAMNNSVSASRCTAIGHIALIDNNGNNNTAVGYEAGLAVTTGSNLTILGYAAAASAVGATDEITLGNSSVATLRCQVTTITSLSDERDKTNIQPIKAGLDFVNQVKAVSFDWNTRDGAKVGVADTGFTAQQLKQVQIDTGVTIPGLVYESNPDQLEAGYGKLIPILVKAIQELTARIAVLEAK